jgi:hypothetical protein
MNDFSELENELRTLRPAQPSPVLFERIEEAMAEDRKASARSEAGWTWRRLFEWKRGPAGDMDTQLAEPQHVERATQMPFRFAIGLAAVAAAVLLLLVRINTDEVPNQDKQIAQSSTKSETSPPAVSGGNRLDRAMASNKFVPAGATQVVYNKRDEGLQFADGANQPLRRLRYQTRETWQWRNPSTGASLRVSYPSEEVVLIPVSGL